MPSISQMLASAEPVPAGFTLEIPSSWLQGRTAYGGLSTALALHAARLCEPDLPPLRSMLVAFIGPLAGRVTVTAEKLRRGRNAAYIETTIRSEVGLGHRATFVFMSDIASTIAHHALTPSPHRPPEMADQIRTDTPNFFGCNFDFANVKIETYGAEWMRWVRLVERDDIDPEVQIAAIADALPLAAFALLRDKQVAMSSLTWMANLLTTRPATTDGWWLLHARTERAVGGHSSQRMTMWNADGIPVVDGMQGVAVFG